MSRLVSGLVLAGLLAAGTLTLAVLVMGGFGYRTIVIESGSMSPALRAGDLVVSRSISPGQVHRGDVVTFHSPALAGALVTHRVTGISPQADAIRFTTKGDANTVPETWSVAASGHVGLAVAQIRHAGWWFQILRTGPGRAAIILLACVWACAVAVPRIWARA